MPSITAAGLFGLTLEKFFIDTAGVSLEAETNKIALVQDGYTPNFDTHDFHADLTNEVTGTNYTVEGEAATTTEITLSSGTLKFDAADTVYATVTISDAMAGVLALAVGSSATNQLVVLQDFVTAASATAANFTIQHNASGIFTLDYTP
ncbi:hypothetical protein LCGC14_1769460 [marine sediment metagenome]|uniref:Uncharacterized protein n=1 Tax=marine sediment metagenome TaxID=412755 RepID=A0A0F9GYN8_9ZZZZ